MIFSKENISNSILAIYIFLYGLLLPSFILLKNNFGITIVTFFIILIAIKQKLILFSNKLILIIFSVFLLVSIKVISTPVLYIDVVKEILIGFSTIGISGVIIGNIKFNISSVFNKIMYVSWINFFILVMIPFTIYYSSGLVNYMRFGYAILPTVMFSFIFLVKKEKAYINGIIFLISFVELLIYGARGAFLTFFIFIFWYYFVYLKIYFKLKFLFRSIVFLTILYFTPIKIYVVDIIEITDSYALAKYLNVINGKSFSSQSSGRDSIFMSGVERFLSSPFLGNHFGTAFMDTGSVYYHNLFLDVLVTFGLIIFSFLVIALIYIFYRLSKTISDINLLISIILILSLGRLVVSSSFWLRPEFWLSFGLIINYFTNKKYRNV